MTQDVRTRPTRHGAGDAYDDEYPSRGFTLTDVFDWIWRFFTSKKTGMALILGMGVLSLAGTLIQQAPDGLRSEPQAYQQFLDSVRPKFAGLTDYMNMLGLFEVFSSVWFKAVTLLLSVSILACSINRLPKLWRAAFRPRTRVPDSFFGRAPLTETIQASTEPDDTRETVRRVLRGNRFHVVVDPDDPGRMYADKFRFGPFGTVVAHLSFIVILLGVLLTASTGFKNTSFYATVGSKVPVGHGTGLTVEAKAFTDAYYADGSPKDYASDIVLYDNGRQVARKTVRVNQPLRYNGIAFYQSTFGNAVEMKATDSAGKEVFSGGVPLVYASDDKRYAVGQMPLPSQGLTVWVVMPASGVTDPKIAAGQVQLEIYKKGSGTPAATEVISQGKPAAINGVTYTFTRERQFTGLIVRRDPGVWFVWIGAALMVTGLIAVFFFPHRRMWVRVRRTPDGSEILAGSPMRRDSAFDAQFRHLTADLTLAAVDARSATAPRQR